MFKAIIKVLPFSILVAASCLAQNPVQQPQTPPSQNLQAPAKPGYEASTALKIKTRLVIVDVVARDSKGLAVTDLKQEDFTILEDGKEQKLRIFNFQQPGSAAGRPRTLPAAAGSMVDNLPHFESPRALNVILMDALNTSRSNQIAARDAMIKFLEKLPENEPIAVYLLGDKLRLLQDFTTDPAVLKEVVRSFKGKSSLYLNTSDASTIGPILPGISQSLLPLMAAQIREFQVQSTVNMMDQRVQLTLSALNSLARTLSGYPGRKNLLWLSEAFPLDLMPSEAVVKSSLNDRHYMHDVARTGHLLSDSQVAIYPLDAAGLTGLPMLDPANGGNSMANGRIAATDLFGGHSTMNDLAERTGGRAFYDRNDLENAVHESIDDGSTYYTLGYYPENKNWNGSFRKIQVKLHRGAVKLRYRIGYFAADNAIFAKLAPRKQDEDFDQALTLNVPISTALPFKAIVLPPSAQTANKVVVNFGADPHALSFSETTDGLQQVNMECAVRVFARKNPDKALSTEARKMGGALNPEAYGKVMKGFFPCQSQVDLQPGDYILRLGVRDNETGLIGTTNAALTIPQQSSAPGSKTENKP